MSTENRTSEINAQKIPKIMGIINLSPTSFAAVGRCLTHDEILNHAASMIATGVDIIDVGAEPTSPHVHPCVSEEEELTRIVSVIELLVKEFPTPISIDTSKPAVMQAAAMAGVAMINDVRALRYEGALSMVAKLNLPVCLMHMAFPQGNPHYQDYQGNIILEVKTFLQERIDLCLAAGISSKNIIIDPGIGGGSFGKTVNQNLILLRHLAEFKKLNYPLLVGVSRKLFIGELTQTSVENRLPGSLAAAIWALLEGVNILRVHDVKETVDVVKLITAIKQVDYSLS